MQQFFVLHRSFEQRTKLEHDQSKQTESIELNGLENQYYQTRYYTLLRLALRPIQIFPAFLLPESLDLFRINFRKRIPHSFLRTNRISFYLLILDKSTRSPLANSGQSLGLCHFRILKNSRHEA